MSRFVGLLTDLLAPNSFVPFHGVSLTRWLAVYSFASLRSVGCFANGLSCASGNCRDELSDEATLLTATFL